MTVHLHSGNSFINVHNVLEQHMYIHATFKLLATASTLFVGYLNICSLIFHFKLFVYVFICNFRQAATLAAQESVHLYLKITKELPSKSERDVF